MSIDVSSAAFNVRRGSFSIPSTNAGLLQRPIFLTCFRVGDTGETGWRSLLSYESRLRADQCPTDCLFREGATGSYVRSDNPRETVRFHVVTQPLPFSLSTPRAKRRDGSLFARVPGDRLVCLFFDPGYRRFVGNNSVKGFAHRGKRRYTRRVAGKTGEHSRAFSPPATKGQRVARFDTEVDRERERGRG